jgi:hypothetical protein
MRKKLQAFTAALVVLLFCGIVLAQEPVVDIDATIHPYLAAAQRHVVEANKEVANSQKANKWDMKGHAEKARELLVQANQELKAAAEAANAAMQKKK